MTLLGCPGCTHIEYLPVALPLPERPALPGIPATELRCLTNDTYTKLVQRDRLQAGHIATLEAVIQATHDADENQP